MENKVDMSEVRSRIDMILAILNLCIDDMDSNMPAAPEASGGKSDIYLGHAAAVRAREIYVPALNSVYCDLFALRKYVEEASV